MNGMFFRYCCRCGCHAKQYQVPVLDQDGQWHEVVIYQKEYGWFAVSLAQVKHDWRKRIVELEKILQHPDLSFSDRQSFKSDRRLYIRSLDAVKAL